MCTKYKRINFRKRKWDEEQIIDSIVWALAAGVLLVALIFSSKAEAADVNLLIAIVECESSGRYNAIGDDGVSVGIAQFQEQTFNEMKVVAHMPRLRWKNPIHQLRLMVWMLDHGYGNRWTCYRKLTKPMDSDREK